MEKEQKYLLSTDWKSQGKIIKSGTILYVHYVSQDFEKENNVFRKCGKNGKPLTMKNAANHFGINNRQTLELLEKGKLVLVQ